jgi:hypothetical protein
MIETGIVKGIFAHDMDWRVVKELDGLQLAREPENPWDKNAVMVIHRKVGVLGYLDRKQAAKYAPLMDAGHRTSCRVKRLYNTVDPQVLIELWVSKRAYAQEAS